MKFTLKEGEQLVKLVRTVIESAFEAREIKIPIHMKEKLSQKGGVFVTLEKKGELRGCIGFPEPIFPIGLALIAAAREAAFKDVRFPPLKKEELKDTIIEISILTPPEEIKAKKEQDKFIRIGQDGLIVEKEAKRGLLLPKIAHELGWEPKKFLSHTCIKAGLPPEAWQDPKTKIYRFRAQVFAEEKPAGKVVEKKF